jgi:hypothetical protein
MADVKGLSDLLQQAAFYEAGGRDPGKSSFDDFQRGFGTVKGVYDFSQDIIKNVLAKKKAELENRETELKNTPVRDVRMPLSPELMRRDANTAPEMIKAQDEYYAKRDAMGDVTIGQDKTLAETEALRAKSSETPLSIKLLPTEAKNRALKAGYTEDDFIDRKTFNAIRGVDPYAPVGTTTPESALEDETIPGNTRLINLSDKTKSGKQLSASQSDAMLGTITSLQLMDEMDRLVKTRKVDVGPSQVKFTNAPGADRYIAALGTDEEREFKKALRAYQSSYLKAQTGSQRGMKEVSFILPATVDPNLKQDKFGLDIESSRKTALKQLKLYSDFAKSKGLDISFLEEQYPEYFQALADDKTSEIERTTSDGRIAIFDANTKQFLRFK